MFTRFFCKIGLHRRVYVGCESATSHIYYNLYACIRCGYSYPREGPWYGPFSFKAAELWMDVNLDTLILPLFAQEDAIKELEQ